MDFRQFAARNVLRNMKAYFAYFLSTSISAALFFSFTMFIFHPYKGTFKSYIEASLLGTEIITYFFLFFFVFYSISVFLKGRYKEFGILYMIGTSKKQILKMIFIENAIISLTATLCGIVTGMVFSKIFLLVIEKLLRIASLPFYFPGKAILVTFLSFILLGLLISLFTSAIIKEKDVLRLLKGTKSPKPAPKTSIVLAILGCILLVAGYYLSFTGNKANLDKTILVILGMVVLATYLLFSQFSGFVISLIKKNRSFYLRNTNLLWVSNLLYRITDNARMFFIISIASSAAFISIGTCYAFWGNTAANMEDRYPLAFTYQTLGDTTKVDEEVGFIENRLKAYAFPYTKIIAEIEYVTESDGGSYTLMQESTYNRLAEQVNLNKVSVGENETVPVITENGGVHSGIGGNSTGNGSNDSGEESINMAGTAFQITGQINGKILPDQPAAMYVVDDRQFERMANSHKVPPLYLFQVRDWSETYQVYDEYEQKYGEDPYSLLLSKSHIFETEKRAYGALMFLSIFIGIIFFVTSGSFIYNKFYMDVETDKKTYKQLNRIGFTFKEIRKVVTVEIGVLFLLPYLVAAVHSSVALLALRHIFKLEVGTAAFSVMGSFLFVQVIYYLLIRKNYSTEIKKQLAAD